MTKGSPKGVRKKKDPDSNQSSRVAAEKSKNINRELIDVAHGSFCRTSYQCLTLEEEDDVVAAEHIDAAEDGSKIKNNESNASHDVGVVCEKPILTTTGKKLLVIEVNGLLADVMHMSRISMNMPATYTRVQKRIVYKRPFCDDFLIFCFEAFHVGIWSSMYNVDALVDFLFGAKKHDLLFCWDRSKCTDTGFKELEDRYKPLLLKELKNIWEVFGGSGKCSPSNTLLIDHSPCTSLRNPPHTAIFPLTYSYEDDKSDISLGPGGNIRVYLEGLTVADDVPSFVQNSRFGQPAITEVDRNWDFYKMVQENMDE